MSSWQSQVATTLVRAFSPGSANAAEDPVKFRTRMDGLARYISRLRDGARSSPVNTGPIRGQWIETPVSRNQRVILYFHGGGYVYGSPATHQAMVARLCAAAGARALLVDYRLAPEHPYPAAIEDALNAFRWLLSMGINPDEIVIAGDQAGGGLAAALLMALRDHQDYMPAAGVLISPWTDLSMSGWSIHANARKDPFVNLKTLSYCAQLYLRGIPPLDALASPYHGYFEGLPPMLVQTSSGEMLHDDALGFARRAEAAGVDITFEAYDTSLHVAPFFPHVPEGRAATERAGYFIRQMTAGEEEWESEVESRYANIQ